jgi:hypothetical protein
MKTPLTHFITAGLVAGVLCSLLAGCEKDDEYFAGDSRLRGTVYFENGITGALDTAYHAQLRVYPTGGDSSKALTYSVASGRFDVTNLKSGNYTLAARLDRPVGASQSYVAYEGWLKVATGHLDTLQIILRPRLRNQTGLQLTVTNAAGYFIPQAQVYLFADSIAGQRNSRTGAGSIANARTNTQGQVVFLNLQPKSYYVSAFSVSGMDTLSNSLPRQIGTKTLVAATPSVPRYTIALQRPPTVIPSPVAPSLRLTVTDTTGLIVLPNSQVCLYASASQIKRRGLDCVNGLFTGTTNAQGVVIFPNLQAASYHVLAVKVLGADTLTNLRSPTALGPLPTQGELRASISLTR